MNVFITILLLLKNKLGYMQKVQNFKMLTRIHRVQVLFIGLFYNIIIVLFNLASVF